MILFKYICSNSLSSDDDHFLRWCSGRLDSRYYAIIINTLEETAPVVVKNVIKRNKYNEDVLKEFTKKKAS